MIILFFCCNNHPADPLENNVNSKDLNNIPLNRGTTTYVHGYVYKQGSILQGATVKLFKGTTYLDQTTTNASGYYEICVCGQNQGTGTYSVVASYTDRFGLWTDSESFYWDYHYGPWDFDIDLYLVLDDTK